MVWWIESKGMRHGGVSLFKMKINDPAEIWRPTWVPVQSGITNPQGNALQGCDQVNV